MANFLLLTRNSSKMVAYDAENQLLYATVIAACPLMPMLRQLGTLLVNYGEISRHVGLSLALGKIYSRYRKKI